MSHELQSLAICLLYWQFILAEVVFILDVLDAAVLPVAI